MLPRHSFHVLVSTTSPVLLEQDKPEKSANDVGLKLHGVDATAGILLLAKLADQKRRLGHLR
jgi:hypothetical protein